MTSFWRPNTFALAAFLTLLPAVTVGGGMALPVMLCLAGALSIRPSLLRQAFETRPITLLLVLALTLWAIASTTWSPLPMDDQVWKLAIMAPLGLMFVAAATADAQSRRLALAGAVAAALVIILLLSVEAIGGLPLNRAAQPDERVDMLVRIGGHGTTILLAIVWAAAAGLLALGGGLRIAIALLLLAGAAWLSTQFDQLSNAAAFVIGLAAFLAAFVLPRVALIATTSGLAGWLIAAPFAVPYVFADQRAVDAIPMSWAHRSAIWRYTSAHTLEAPIVGHGLEASRAQPNTMTEVRGMEVHALPLHPHSGSLQIWYELGGVGVALAALALVAGGIWLARNVGRDRPAAAAACGTLACLGVIFNVSYGFWAEWWMATMFIAAAVAGAVRARA